LELCSPENQVRTKDCSDGFVEVECKKSFSGKPQIGLLREWIKDPTPLLPESLQPKGAKEKGHKEEIKVK
jgi:hypothetical protein